VTVPFSANTEQFVSLLCSKISVITTQLCVLMPILQSASANWIYYTPAPQRGSGVYFFYTPAPRRGRGVHCFTSVRPSVLPSVQDIFRSIFLSNYWWQESDIWSQASYRYAILWEAFLDSSDSYFLVADLVGFYTHWTYMHIFRHIFLSNYWWQRSDICIDANPFLVQSVRKNWDVSNLWFFSVIIIFHKILP
jgi:hypothetical protein